jgi:hypothetical protein
VENIMTEAALQTVPQPTSHDTEIIRIIGELREVFEAHFDRTWFALLIDEMPIDFRAVREIRRLVSLKSIFPGEEWEVWQRVQEMEEFILHVKRFLLPVLKERLGVSWLTPSRRSPDRTQIIIREFVAFTFPYNLERLRVLTEKLKASLRLHYPFLQ